MGRSDASPFLFASIVFPSRAARISPPSGTLTTSRAITFTWQAGEGDPPDAYNLQLDSSDGHIATITTTTTTSPTLLPVGVHTWTVRAFNTAGYSDWATPWVVQVEQAYYHTYLPLAARNYPAVINLSDAPDTCPGLSITTGQSYQDNFDEANDNDWFAFTAVAGATYAIETYQLGSQADTILQLRAPDCATTLAENDDRQPGDPSSLIVWTAPASSVYHAMVRSYDWQIYGADTQYTFLVSTR